MPVAAASRITVSQSVSEVLPPTLPHKAQGGYVPGSGDGYGDEGGGGTGERLRREIGRGRLPRVGDG